MLKPGQIVFTVLAKYSSNEKTSHIAASIGVAKPRDSNCYGYLSEFHGTGKDEKECGEFAEDLAATMLATTLGIEFDREANYDTKKEVFHMSNKIIETKNISISSIVEKENAYTTVVAATVFIVE